MTEKIKEITKDIDYTVDKVVHLQLATTSLIESYKDQSLKELEVYNKYMQQLAIDLTKATQALYEEVER